MFLHIDILFFFVRYLDSFAGTMMHTSMVSANSNLMVFAEIIGMIVTVHALDIPSDIEFKLLVLLRHISN